MAYPTPLLIRKTLYASSCLCGRSIPTRPVEEEKKCLKAVTPINHDINIMFMVQYIESHPRATCSQMIGTKTWFAINIQSNLRAVVN